MPLNILRFELQEYTDYRLKIPTNSICEPFIKLIDARQVSTMTFITLIYFWSL